MDLQCQPQLGAVINAESQVHLTPLNQLKKMRTLRTHIKA